MSDPFDLLWVQLRPTTTLITPQSQLAKQLTNEYHQQQRRQGRLTWPTPDIISVDGWLTRHWLQTPDPAIPLKLSTEPLIWQQIIHQHPPASMIDTAHLAHLACQAWTLAHQWQLPMTESHFKITRDSYFFWQWQQQFRQYCQQRHCISMVQISDALIPQLSHLELSDHILLVGFDEPSPQLQTLLRALRQWCQVTSFTPSYSPAPVRTFAFANETMEIRAMLLWARQQSTHEQVGCFVPHLRSMTQKILSIDSQITDASQPPLAISRPLIEYPLIHSAFISLQWLTAAMPVTLIHRWLRSPFIVHSERDFFHYGQLSQALSGLNVTELSLSTLCDQLSVISQSVLLQRLQQLRQLSIPVTASPSQWGQLFWHGLTLLGWPGEREPTAQEQLLIEQWQQLLQEFAGLDPILQPMSLTQALQCLNQLATMHHGSSPTPNASIQLLDRQQTNGLIFDQLWVMGMNDESWPSPPTPNPLLPYPLQRQYQIPHATAGQQLQFAQRLTNTWRQSCRQLHLSFAQQVEDQPRQLSPLCTQWPTVAARDEPSAPFCVEPPTMALETWHDANTPLTHDAVPIRGGSGILTAQAQCPFRAFALYRLQIPPRDTLITGVSPIEHGQLVHQVLDYFWTQMKTHRHLVTQPPDQTTQLLERCIDRALTTLTCDSSPSLFFALEKIRLQRLLKRWLVLEQQRPAFSVIAIEQSTTIDLAGLPLTIRCDRVDQLDDGTQLMIDYKTGASTPSDWFGERPSQPQLPLYSLTNAAISAISFAQLTPDELKFKGVSDQPTHITGIQPMVQASSADTTDWKTQQQQWRKQLTQLSQTFQQGVATVDPKPGVCRTCGLHSLCRIQDPTL